MGWASKAVARGGTRRSILICVLPATTTSVVKQTERAMLLNLWVKLWPDSITDEPESRQLEVWFPKSKLHYMSSLQRYGVDQSFIQTKEEEIAQKEKAKRVGIVVETTTTITRTDYF